MYICAVCVCNLFTALIFLRFVLACPVCCVTNCHGSSSFVVVIILPIYQTAFVSFFFFFYIHTVRNAHTGDDLRTGQWSVNNVC